MSDSRERNLLDGLLQRPVAFHPIFARITASATAALFLSQMWYWSTPAKNSTKETKGLDPDGWIYKSGRELTDETGLSKKEQQTARRIWRGLQVLEEQRRGNPCRLYYRIDKKKLADLIAEPSSWPQKGPLVGRSRDGKWTRKGPTITESTAGDYKQETTPETTKSETESKKVPADGRDPLTTSQEMSDYFWNILPEDFRTGAGSRRDLFRAVERLGVTAAEAREIGAPYEGPFDNNNTELFDRKTGAPLCTPAEWLEDEIAELRG